MKKTITFTVAAACSFAALAPLAALAAPGYDTDDHGVVTLRGKVPGQDAADRAISIARATEGVREVKSALKVKIDD